MIIFKTKEDVLPSVLILVSIALVVGVLIYILLFPVPDALAYRQQTNAKIATARDQIDSQQKQETGDRAAIASRLWNGDQNHVSAAVLAQVTSSTSANGIKLAAFRPQRTIDLDGIIELPYAVQLSGPYSGIRSVMRNFDSNDSMLVLRSVQVNASEEVTGTVTATLGISAYIASDSQISAAIAGGGGQDAAVH